MKKTLIISELFLFLSFSVFSQSIDVTESKLRDVAGQQIVSAAFDNGGKPYIICFWARWNLDSHEFLNKMNSLYKNWNKQTGVKLITVAVDEAPGSDKISPFIMANGWKYENYIDEEQGFKKLMHVYDIPSIIVFNGSKEVTLQLNSYKPGDEYAIYDALKAGK